MLLNTHLHYVHLNVTVNSDIAETKGFLNLWAEKKKDSGADL